MVRILGIGDNMVDKNLTTGMMYPGGQAMNIAVNTKMLGAQTGFIGPMGDDYVADHIKNTLDEIGVDRSRSRTYHCPHAFARYKVINEDRVFQSEKKRNPLQWAIRNMLGYEGLSGEDLEYIKTFDLVHSSDGAGMDFIQTELPKIKATGVPLSFDFSVYHNEPGFMEAVCPNAYFVLLSCSHMTVEEMRDRLKKAYDLGSRICIATRGSEGATLYDGKDFYTQAPHMVKAKDTMGAGDAFISAFLYTFLHEGGMKAEDRGQIIRDALLAAAEYSAKACMVDGSFGHGAPYQSEF